MAKGKHSGRRISRESAIPASALEPWQRWQLEASWKVKSFINPHTGMIHYVVPYSKRDSIPSDPGHEYLYEPESFFTDYQIANINPVLRFYDQYTGDHYILIEKSKIPPGSEPEIEFFSPEEEPEKIPVSPPLIGKKPRIEKPPKAARLRYAISEGDAKGKFSRFPVVQISKNIVTVRDIDEKPPAGFRAPKEAFGKIITDRGVQYLLPPNTPYDGLGDMAYELASRDRGSYDIRTLKKWRTIPGKVNSRKIIPLGEGREIFKGRKGKYSSLIKMIEKPFTRGGGKPIKKTPF